MENYKSITNSVTIVIYRFLSIFFGNWATDTLLLIGPYVRHHDDDYEHKN